MEMTREQNGRSQRTAAWIGAGAAVGAALIGAAALLVVTYLERNDEQPPASASPANSTRAPATCVIDLSADMGSLTKDHVCDNGRVATVAASPENNTFRPGGNTNWAGMISAWAVPDGWEVQFRLSDGSNYVASGSSGFSPNDPRNDTVNVLRIVASTPGEMRLASCYNPCDPNESNEKIVIRIG